MKHDLHPEHSLIKKKCFYVIWKWQSSGDAQQISNN